jgi:hypothetical protein
MTDTIAAQLRGITDKELSKERLLEDYLKETKTVYTVLRGASSSGLTQYVSLMVPGLDHDGKPDLYNITWHASNVLGDKLHDKHGHRVIKLQGGGMDLGFNVVYNLSSVLYAGQDRAGYVLKHRWL